jgi:hypothetical protein
MKAQQRAFKQAQGEGRQLLTQIASEENTQAFQAFCQPLEEGLLDAMVFAHTETEATQSRQAYKAAWQALVLWTADKQPKTLVRASSQASPSSSSSSHSYPPETEEEAQAAYEHFIETSETEIHEEALPYLLALREVKPSLFVGLNLYAPIPIAQHRKPLYAMLKYYHTDHRSGNSEEDKRVAQEVVRIYKEAMKYIGLLTQARADIRKLKEKLVRKDEEIARKDEEIARKDEEIARRDERIARTKEETARTKEETARIRAERMLMEQELESLKRENEHGQAEPVGQEAQKTVALAQDPEQLKQEEAHRRSEELAAQKQKVAELREWREVWGKKTGSPSPLLFASTDEPISPTTDENTSITILATTPPSLPRVCATVFSAPPDDAFTLPALTSDLVNPLIHEPHHGF